MKKVYILLTRTTTVFAKAMHRVTGDEFTHCSLGLDRPLNKLYSFARRSMRVPVIAGFVKESLYTQVFARNQDAPCALLSLEVTDEVYLKIEQRINDMLNNYDRYKYNFVGVFTCYFNIKYQPKYHFVCSQFVSQILESAGALVCPKPSALMKPVDFLSIPELKLIYRGKLKYCTERKKRYGLTRGIHTYRIQPK